MSVASEQTAPYLKQFAERKAALPDTEAPWLGATREDAIQRFAETGFPTPRVEDWKYTNLNRLSRATFVPAPPVDEVDPAIILPWSLPDGEALRLVFVNGRFVPALSAFDDLPEGVTLTTVAQEAGEDGSLLSSQLGALAAPKGCGLVALNTAFMRDGLVLRLEPDAALDRPVELLHVTLPAEASVVTYPRNLVVAGECSCAVIVETYAGAGGTPYWTNAVTEMDIGAGARIHHVRLQSEPSPASHIGLAQLRLARDAEYEGVVMSMGASLARSEVRVAMEGEGAVCRLTGGALLADGQHSDITTEIDHKVPYGQSAQLFKSVLDGHSRSVFQGRVVVRPDAQKTDAQQQNRNLLLSPRAQADAKPELNIFADDVKCSHGATVGDLDANALFYLMSRGIDTAGARALLVEAFIGDIVDAIVNETVRTMVRGRVADWLGGLDSSAEEAA